ncbi:HCP-like protein [Gigaspora margarita]|uniref:HCP-like protein n=1 Tax=Gigaspora margarita TaxID=4874 RepID=A0A8H3WWR3_GIGMA|nr:HCP-like protein [Gigaspora margarita]
MRVSSIKSFSLHQNMNFSNRNVLTRFKRFRLFQLESNVSYKEYEMKPQDKMDSQGEMDLQGEMEMQDKIESEGEMEAQDEVEMQSAIEDIEEDYIVREDNSVSNSNNDSITDEGVIVDAPMSMNTNESASYFENPTSAKMFCWIQKHNISTSAYNDLVEILQNPAFKADNVVRNI